MKAEEKILQDPKRRAKLGKRTGAVGIGCNVLLFAGKLTVGILSGAVSILADALNNLTDAASAIVTLIGFKLAEKPADSEHPYGHARYEYLSGLGVAALILIIGFELAKSSLQKIFSPAPVSLSVPMVIALGMSVLIKLWMSLYYRRVGKKIQSTALMASSVDSRNDVITTAAVLAAGVVETFTKLPADGYVGLAVALFILYSGIQLGKETISPLLGEGASPELRQVIVETVSTESRVLGYHDLMVHDYGPGQRFASIHVEMDQKEDPLLCHELIDEMERICLEKHNIHLVVHYDPVVTDNEELNALQTLVRQILREMDERLSVHDFRMVRRSELNTLFFDVGVPENWEDRTEDIQKAVENALEENTQSVYDVRITFDLAAFNL